MISIKIVGVREREYMIDEMNRQLQLPAGDIIYDERPGGGYAFPILKKAWLDPYVEEETHRVVLNDDLELCDDFINICNQIAKGTTEFRLCLFFQHILTVHIVIKKSKSFKHLMSGMM